MTIIDINNQSESLIKQVLHEKNARMIQDPNFIQDIHNNSSHTNPQNLEKFYRVRFNTENEPDSLKQNPFEELVNIRTGERTAVGDVYTEHRVPLNDVLTELKAFHQIRDDMIQEHLIIDLNRQFDLQHGGVERDESERLMHRELDPGFEQIPDLETLRNSIERFPERTLNTRLEINNNIISPPENELDMSIDLELAKGGEYYLNLKASPIYNDFINSLSDVFQYFPEDAVEAIMKIVKDDEIGSFLALQPHLPFILGINTYYHVFKPLYRSGAFHSAMFEAQKVFNRQKVELKILENDFNILTYTKEQLNWLVEYDKKMERLGLTPDPNELPPKKEAPIICQDSLKLREERLAFREERLTFREERLAFREEKLELREEKLKFQEEKQKFERDKFKFIEQQRIEASLLQEDLNKSIKEEGLKDKAEKERKLSFFETNFKKFSNFYGNLPLNNKRLFEGSFMFICGLSAAKLTNSNESILTLSTEPLLFPQTITDFVTNMIKEPMSELRDRLKKAVIRVIVEAVFEFFSPKKSK